MSFDNYLESRGWTRQIAGATDFDAAVRACEQMDASGLGLLVSGDYGVGKTALANVVAAYFCRQCELFRVRLGVPSDLDMLRTDWQEYFCHSPWTSVVLLDDVGAELPVSEYGVRIERVTNFLAEYHEQHRGASRLIVTTNYNAEEFDSRYGGRMTSRCKDLMIPLRLTGKDKRQWKTWTTN